jgi:hypothetical protein
MRPGAALRPRRPVDNTNTDIVPSCINGTKWSVADGGVGVRHHPLQRSLDVGSLHVSRWNDAIGGNMELKVDDYIADNINYLRDVLGVRLPPAG